MYLNVPMYLYSRADTMVYVWLLFIYSISSTETRHILLHLLLLCQLGFKAEIQIIFRTVQAEETEVVILCRDYKKVEKRQKSFTERNNSN